MSGKSTSVPVEELDSWLQRRLAAEVEGPTVVVAGHFVLDRRGDELEDHLDDEDVLPEPLDSFREMARVSWKAACAAVARAQRDGRSASLAVLVNDWQFVTPAHASDRRSKEREAQRARDTYYERVRTLPAFHIRTLHETGLDFDSVWKNDEQQWMYSEQDLRKRLAKTVRERLRDNPDNLSVELSPNGEPVVKVVSPALGEYTLLYCGNTNCAGEVAQLYGELRERSVGRAILLYPISCLGPVLTGTQLGQELFGLKGMRVSNVAMPWRPESSGKERLVVDEFRY